MKIQSLSIVVPNRGCVNKCPFCVSRMVKSDRYENRMDINHPHYDINVREYLKRLRFVADNGCQTVMLTGTSEPQQNKQFLATFALLHQQLGSPFANIEMQTTGYGLDCDRDYIRFLRNFVGVNTVALSVNSLDDVVNCSILGHEPERDPMTGRPVAKFRLYRLCDALRDYDFNIRCCFNLTAAFDMCGVEQVFDVAKNEYHANQVTFRELYSSSADTEQGEWIRKNAVSQSTVHEIEKYLRGRPVVGRTMYGATCYDVNGMSVIYDTDCMGKNPVADVLKYLILRPDCHLYSQWDTPASRVN